MARGKKGGGVNKMEAVRQVIGKYGKAVMPVDIVKHAKDEHGAVLSTGMASNYKSAALKELGLRGKRQSKPGPRAGWKTDDGAKLAGNVTIEDIAAVKKLCDQMGAEKVKQLALVLAK